MKSTFFLVLALVTLTLGACAQQNAPTTSTQSASRTSTYSK